jgi:hypothetical protein
MIHELLPFLIAVMGIYAGVYTLLLIRKTRIAQDRILFVNFLVLGVLNLYIGIVYSLVILGVVHAVPLSDLSLFMRPANFLQIFLPFLISKRMGL